MAFLKEKCGHVVKEIDGVKLLCSRLVEITKRVKVGLNKEFQVLGCGHTRVVDTLEIKADRIRDIVSLDGKSLYPFQAHSVEFAEKANFNCIIAHEMGLGKTPISIVGVLLHPEIHPVLFVVKSSLKVQFFKEIVRWSNGKLIPQIIETSNDKIERGYPIAIISFDLVRRMVEKLDKHGFKALFIDECQMIKNTEAKRTQKIRELVRGIDNVPKIKHVIGLSGTPVKNNAGEYFSILNLVRRDLFWSHHAFIYNECETVQTAYGPKVGGLKDPANFFSKTKDFIIRFERKEVMPELPSVSRLFRYTNMSDDITNDEFTGKAQEAYDNKLKEFTAFFDTADQTDRDFYSNALAYLSKMRHITGLAKVGSCVDFIMEFMGGRPESDKLTVFVHHRDVAFMIHKTLIPLFTELGLEEPEILLGDVSSAERQEMIERFRDDPKRRLFICSTLAGGEGLNLQFCADAVLMERQWNPANEEQAEARFIRIGQLAQAVNVTYIIAVNTIDEYFAQIVETKREIMQQTLGSEVTQWKEASVIRDLMEILAQKGRKKIWDHRNRK